MLPIRMTTLAGLGVGLGGGGGGQWEGHMFFSKNFSNSWFLLKLERKF